MISASRSSVCSKLQESREAFCCISSALVATPPALAALPGAKVKPASLMSLMAAGVQGMLAPSATITQPFLINVWASLPLSSFCVGARQGDVAGHLPDRCRIHVVCVATHFGVFADATPPAQLDLLEKVQIDALLVDDVAGGVGAGDDAATEFVDLLDGVDGDVAGSGYDHPLAVEGFLTVAEDLLGEVDGTVAGGFGTDLASRPRSGLCR